MHAHFEQIEWGPLYLAAGVTTVRDCGNELDFIKAVRDSIDAGKGVGPRILLAYLVDGQGEGALGNEKIRTADDIDAVIKRFADAGCAQVKLYSSIDPRLIEPIARSAHRAGMTVIGHVPAGIGAVHAVEAGFDGINHLSFVTRALFPPAYDPDKVLDQRGGEPGATGALRRPHSFTGWAARAGAWRSRPSAAIDVPRSGHSLQPLRNVTDCALRPARLLLCASHDG
jgi:hypothetical protein